jgi:hydrogenase nickel incorporation protein HypB
MEAWLAWLLAGPGAARAARSQNVDVLKRRIAELEAQLAARG